MSTPMRVPMEQRRPKTFASGWLVAGVVWTLLAIVAWIVAVISLSRSPLDILALWVPGLAAILLSPTVIIGAKGSQAARVVAAIASWVTGSLLLILLAWALFRKGTHG